MTDALIDGEEEKKNHLLYMSDGAYELGLERGWGGRGGWGGVVSQQCQLCEQEQEVRRLETHSRRPPPDGRDVTWPQSHPSARGRSCQQPEALTAGSLFANLTFDLNRDRREGARGETRL